MTLHGLVEVNLYELSLIMYNECCCIFYTESLIRWQHHIKLSEAEKNHKLNDLLDALDFNQVVIFVKSVNSTAELNKLLTYRNFPSISIHSGVSQEERSVNSSLWESVSCFSSPLMPSFS